MCRDNIECVVTKIVSLSVMGLDSCRYFTSDNRSDQNGVRLSGSSLVGLFCYFSGEYPDEYCTGSFFVGQSNPMVERPYTTCTTCS